VSEGKITALRDFNPLAHRLQNAARYNSTRKENAKIRRPLGITTKSVFVFAQVRRETGEE
jgi:hypothetical protein